MLVTTFGVGELSALNGIAYVSFNVVELEWLSLIRCIVSSQSLTLLLTYTSRPLGAPSVLWPPPTSGSMAERLPILHLVGLPSTRLQGSHALLHHTLGNGSFDTFSAMSSHLVATVGILKQGTRWTDEVDRVMGVALTEVSVGTRSTSEARATRAIVRSVRSESSGARITARRAKRELLPVERSENHLRRVREAVVGWPRHHGFRRAPARIARRHGQE